MRPVDVRFAEMDAGFDFDFGLLLALGLRLDCARCTVDFPRI